MATNYRRVLLKVSGEMLSGDNTTIDQDKLSSLCNEILKCYQKGIQLALVIGAGNIFRGHTYNGKSYQFDRVDADKMGMIATIVNALALQAQLEVLGVKTLLQSSFPIEGVCERFNKKIALEALNKGRIIIFCGGTGNPFFSTDSAAALRACELGVDILLKGTNVDGVYDSNPKINKNAKKFDTLTYNDAIAKQLKVLDQTAFVLCMENSMPMRIFNVHVDGNIEKVISGEDIGTFICN